PLDVGRLLDRMDEAVIPEPGGTGRFGHTLSPSINTAHRRGGYAPDRERTADIAAGPHRARARCHEAQDAGAVLGTRKTSAPYSVPMSRSRRRSCLPRQFFDAAKVPGTPPS